MGRLAGKAAFVTGAGSGIGRGIAEAFAREGARVLLTDIDESGGRETAALIAKAGGTAHFMRQDVTEEGRWTEVMRELDARFGTLSVLVNNAGIAIGGPIEDFSLADWRQQQAINLDGVFLGTRAGIRAMKLAGGAIINMSSVAGFKGSAGLAGYAATKGGVRLFSKSAAVECARLGYKIRVNSVHPGIIDTPIWTKGITGVQKMAPGGSLAGANALDPEQISLAAVPVGVAGKPADIAAMCVFLASDEARYVTGTELIVDGGFTA